MRKSVIVQWKWRCPLCSDTAQMFAESFPLGWYKLSGCRNIPLCVFDEDDCPQEAPEIVICAKCAKILQRTLEILNLPFRAVEPNNRDYDKLLSLGMIAVLA